MYQKNILKHPLEDRLMEKKRKSILYIVLYSHLGLLLLSCNNNNTNPIPKKEIGQKENCSSVTMFSVTMFTNVNLESVDSVLIKLFRKGEGYTTALKNNETKILFRQYDKKLQRWDFDINDSLDVNYDYQFFFIKAHDTTVFSLSDLEIGEKLIYAGGQESSYCELIKYTVNEKKYTDNGNIYFIK